MIPVGGNQFRAEDSEDATAIFTSDGKDKPVMVVTYAARHRDSGLFCQNQPLWPMTRLALVLGAIAAMLSSIVFAIIWIPRRILAGKVEHLAIRILPLLATLSLSPLSRWR